jgi:phosphatidylglycerol:prolipoprotein diacylglycerol transferase
MLQTLFHIPAEIGGYPVFGFGILLAVWALGSVALLGWLLVKQGPTSDTWGYVPVLLLLGAVIAWVLPALCDEHGLPIRGYGTMMLIGVLSGIGLAVRRARQVGIEADTIFSMAFWMLVPGIIGGRLFYVIEYWHEYAKAYTEPGGSLGAWLGGVVNVAQGGLVVYGAFFGGTAGMLWFIHRKRLPLLATCDLIAPSMMLGLALGRVGCFLNGCCFGGECDCAWAVCFPPESPAYHAQAERGQFYGMEIDAVPTAEPRLLSVADNSPAAMAGLKPGDLIVEINGIEIATAKDAHHALADVFYQGLPLRLKLGDGRKVAMHLQERPARSRPVHPTQLYSAADAALLCLILLLRWPYRRRDGEIFALMMTIHPIIRFGMEIIRTDEAAVFGTGMSISQNVSLLLLLCAAALWIYILRRPPGLAWPGKGSHSE